MSRIRGSFLIPAAMLALALASVPLPAQEPEAAARATPVPTRPRDIQLIFEREIFSYPVPVGRRDPFKSLAEEEALGPLFDDLTLRMIIHSDRPGQSVALVVDGAKKVYRLRRGDTVGNATVLDISPTRVVFTVEDFGNRRQEVLDLKAKNQKEGA